MRNKLNSTYQALTTNHYLFQLVLIGLITFSWCLPVMATLISDRILQFPQWQGKPDVQRATGDLEYPEWIAGTWNVQSTLVEQIAPLAPKLVTPGFTSNAKYLDQAIAFQVRFGSQYYSPPTGIFAKLQSSQPKVVADRAFNGEKIAQAYLGEGKVAQVKVDPQNPNQQITFLEGERQLIAKITGRASEIPNLRQFITTEVTQQLFKSPERIYLNEVETTANYDLLDSNNISVQQITAIYLSPQDPDYFKAGDRPVALYRYHLDLTKAD